MLVKFATISFDMNDPLICVDDFNSRFNSSVKKKKYDWTITKEGTIKKQKCKIVVTNTAQIFSITFGCFVHRKQETVLHSIRYIAWDKLSRWSFHTLLHFLVRYSDIALTLPGP